MADTTQTIRSFYDVASQREFSRDFLFRVMNITFNGGAVFDERDLVYLRAAKLPGRNITNVATKYMGLAFNIPGGVTYPGSDAYALEFYCDANSNIRQKLETESRRTFDDTTSSGDYNIATAASIMTLVQLDKGLNAIDQYNLVGVSIRDVGELEYKIAEGTGEYVTFTSTIAYHFFELVAPSVQT
jgi:hypothetical protein